MEAILPRLGHQPTMHAGWRSIKLWKVNNKTLRFAFKYHTRRSVDRLFVVIFQPLEREMPTNHRGQADAIHETEAHHLIIWWSTKELSKGSHQSSSRRRLWRSIGVWKVLHSLAREHHITHSTQTAGRPCQTGEQPTKKWRRVIGELFFKSSPRCLTKGKFETTRRGVAVQCKRWLIVEVKQPVSHSKQHRQRPIFMGWSCVCETQKCTFEWETFFLPCRRVASFGDRGELCDKFLTCTCR